MSFVRVTTMRMTFASVVSFCVRSWTHCSRQLICARPNLLITRHSCSLSGRQMLSKAGLVRLIVWWLLILSWLIDFKDGNLRLAEVLISDSAVFFS